MTNVDGGCERWALEQTQLLRRDQCQHTYVTVNYMDYLFVILGDSYRRAYIQPRSNVVSASNTYTN